MTSTQPFTLTLTDLLPEISARLTRAGQLVDAALTLATAGAEEEAVQVILDVESDSYEVDRLLSVATLLNRMRHERPKAG